MSNRAEKSILEMLEPLVYDELKVWTIMGGKNSQKCQAILFAWREWLQNHWKEDSNIKTNRVGKYSVWFNKFSKDVILFYALKGYKFFADTQRKEPERLMKMAIKAHAIEIGTDFTKPKVILIDPLRINVEVISAFQRADDLFAHPEKYVTKDKNGNIIITESGWLPSKEEAMSPIFMWQVLAAYETNLFSHEYFIKAKKLSKGEYKNDWNSVSDSTDGKEDCSEKYFSQRLKDIFRTDTQR